MTNLSILLMIKESFLRDILKFILEAYFNCTVIAPMDEPEALKLLGDKTNLYDLVVYDYDPFSTFVDDLKAMVRARPKLISIILVQGEHEQNMNAFSQAGMRLLKKEDVPLGLIREICAAIPAQEILNNSQFCRIAINLLVRFDGIKKNLFIKIGTARMVQIFKEDDKTDMSEIMKYHLRGIEHLYMKRSTTEIIVTQIQRQIKVFLKANNFKFVLKTGSDSPGSAFEQRILRINDELYIDDEFQKVIQETINRLKDKVMKEKRIDLFLSNIMNMPNLFEFFSKKVELTSLFTILICQKMKWLSQGTNDKIVYAAVLADITLAVRPKLLQIRDIDEFNACAIDLDEGDRDFFLNHPQECSALANKFFQAAPGDTSSIILQHHELPDGRGFPSGLKADKIFPLAAAFIVANDFAHYILSDDAPSVDEYLADNKDRWDFPNFRQAYKAILELRETRLKYLSKQA